MADRKLVLVLRREEVQLDPEHRRSIERLYPGHVVQFRRTDPADYQQHDDDCRVLRPAAIVLPQRPIPALAMEHGFPHITVFPDGQVMELEPLVPTFKPFVPK